jgi:hypothetical protein
MSPGRWVVQIVPESARAISSENSLKLWLMAACSLAISLRINRNQPKSMGDRDGDPMPFPMNAGGRPYTAPAGLLTQTNHGGESPRCKPDGEYNEA